VPQADCSKGFHSHFSVCHLRFSSHHWLLHAGGLKASATKSKLNNFPQNKAHHVQPFLYAWHQLVLSERMAEIFFFHCLPLSTRAVLGRAKCLLSCWVIGIWVCMTGDAPVLRQMNCCVLPCTREQQCTVPAYLQLETKQCSLLP